MVAVPPEPQAPVAGPGLRANREGVGVPDVLHGEAPGVADREQPGAGEEAARGVMWVSAGAGGCLTTELRGGQRAQRAGRPLQRPVGRLLTGARNRHVKIC